MGALGTLIPLVIFFGFLGGFAWVGYEMYLYSSGLGEQGKKSLEKRNIVYTKDGVRVGVKDKTDEQINDKVQSAFVKTLDYAGEPDPKRASSRPSSGRPSTVSRSSSGFKP